MYLNAAICIQNMEQQENLQSEAESSLLLQNRASRIQLRIIINTTRIIINTAYIYMNCEQMNMLHYTLLSPLQSSSLRETPPGLEAVKRDAIIRSEDTSGQPASRGISSTNYTQCNAPVVLHI